MMFMLMPAVSVAMQMATETAGTRGKRGSHLRHVGERERCHVAVLGDARAFAVLGALAGPEPVPLRV